MSPTTRDDISDAMDALHDKLARDLVAHAPAAQLVDRIAPARELAFSVVCDSRDREPWLKARRSTVGASESAIVLGVSPWSSLLAMWCEKTGRTERDEFEGEWLFWGNKLENAIIDGYAERTGRFAMPFGLLLRSNRWPWLSATPDAIVTDDPECGKRAALISRTLGHIRAALKKGASTAQLVPELVSRMQGWWPLQIKTIGLPSVHHWKDGVPIYYETQCIQEALVFGADRTTAAGLIAGQRLIWDDVDAASDGLLARRIVNLCKAFMVDHVEADVEPTADGSDSARRALAALYPTEDPQSAVLLDAEYMEMAHELDKLKAEQKITKKTIDTYENRIRQAMGLAERCVLPDSSGFTLKANVNGSRVLTRKHVKGD